MRDAGLTYLSTSSIKPLPTRGGGKPSALTPQATLPANVSVLLLAFLPPPTMLTMLFYSPLVCLQLPRRIAPPYFLQAL